MTGVVEAVSLTLAVLPIIISATEHFSSTTSVFKRYRQYSSEVGRLSTLVKVQRTIFHGEIRSLLASCVSWEQAELLLQDTDNAKWDDRSLERALASRLGDARESFLELVHLINAELSVMEARLTGFDGVIQLAKDVGVLSSHKGTLTFSLQSSATQKVSSNGVTSSNKNLASHSPDHGFKIR
jgi:hypothetical protein